jgi:hypothetical protein
VSTATTREMTAAEYAAHVAQRLAAVQERIAACEAIATTRAQEIAACVAERDRLQDAATAARSAADTMPAKVQEAHARAFALKGTPAETGAQSAVKALKLAHATLTREAEEAEASAARSAAEATTAMAGLESERAAALAEAEELRALVAGIEAEARERHLAAGREELAAIHAALEARQAQVAAAQQALNEAHAAVEALQAEIPARMADYPELGEGWRAEVLPVAVDAVEQALLAHRAMFTAWQAAVPAIGGVMPHFGGMPLFHLFTTPPNAVAPALMGGLGGTLFTERIALIDKWLDALRAQQAQRNGGASSQG